MTHQQKISVVILSLFLFGAGCEVSKPNALPASNIPLQGADIESGGLQEMPIVSISAEGFNPATITIKKGENVMWLNEDPKSDHSPDFDPPENIPPGGSRSFTFEKVGSFAYHDRLHEELKGLVIVSE